MKKEARNMELGNLLFYGGAALMAAAAVLGLAAFILYRLRAAKLKRALESEYGPQEKRS